MVAAVPTQPTPEEEDAKATELLKLLQAENAWDDGNLFDVRDLKRFLRAREWRLEDAKSAWLTMMNWRKDWQIDTIMERQLLSAEQSMRYRKLFPHGLHGVDKEGRPIMIYRLGQTDCTKALAEFPDKLRQQVQAQLLEYITRVAMPGSSMHIGKHVDRMVVIYDLSGISMSAANSYAALLTPPTQITGWYYPDFLAQLFVVNAPMVFDSMFALSKRLLSPTTQKKIQVFGSRATASGLAKFISPDQLPKDLGGTSSRLLSENWGPWTAALLQMPSQVPPDTTQPGKPVDEADVAVEAVAGPDDERVPSQRTLYAAESFHTCLSAAESAFLTSFLHQRPASSRYFVPGMGATFRRDEVPIIEEESVSATRVGTADSIPQMTGSLQPTGNAREAQPGCCPWLCFRGNA